MSDKKGSMIEPSLPPMNGKRPPRLSTRAGIFKGTDLHPPSPVQGVFPIRHLIPNVLFPIHAHLSSMVSSQPEETRLSRSLGLAEVTLSGIGIILGAGIYALIGTAAAGAEMQSGSPLPFLP